MKTAHNKKGFTLVEILVVISIIGLLSAVVLGSLSSARIKGRDAARMVDVRELKKALEFYYNDQSPVSYPKIGTRLSANPLTNGVGLLDAPLRGGSVKYIGGIAQILIDGNGLGDTDLYVWSNSAAPADPADSYAIAVYRESGVLCKTGAGPLFPNGFWAISIPTVCPF